MVHSIASVASYLNTQPQCRVEHRRLRYIHLVCCKNSHLRGRDSFKVTQHKPTAHLQIADSNVNGARVPDRRDDVVLEGNALRRVVLEEAVTHSPSFTLSTKRNLAS